MFWREKSLARNWTISNPVHSFVTTPTCYPVSTIICNIKIYASHDATSYFLQLVQTHAFFTTDTSPHLSYIKCCCKVVLLCPEKSDKLGGFMWCTKYLTEHSVKCLVWCKTPTEVLNWYTGCPRRNVPNFRRVFLMLKYTDITQNTYVQSGTVTEIMAREVWKFDSWYSLIDYQIHIETGRNMWFL